MTYCEDDRTDISLIGSYLEMGRFSKAEPLIRKALKADPDQGLLHYWLALCYYATNRPGDARSPLETAMRLGYDPASCHQLMGEILEELNELPQAEAHYLESLRLEPDCSSAMGSYGRLLLRSGHRKKGLAVLDEALRLDPSDTTALGTRSLYLLSYGTRKEQLEHMAVAIRMADTEIKTLLYAAVYELNHNKLWQARETIRQMYLQLPENNQLLEVLDELSLRCSILYLPVRLMERIGGPVVLWIIMAVGSIAANRLLSDMAGAIVILVMLLFVIATWIGPLAHLAFGRKRRRSKRKRLQAAKGEPFNG